MPLSLNEIKDRALAFSREWEGVRAERAEAQTFWNEFFVVFGISRRRVATFEEPVKTLPLFDNHAVKGGRIDLFWRGVLIAEHKSRGRDLGSAYKQALDYFAGLPERDLPRYVIVSDFARIRLYDLDTDALPVEFPLKDLYKRIKLFGFIAGYTTQRIVAQDPVNIKAAERMGKLHDRLRASGYQGHNLEVLLVRLLFCLFAEDTTLFEPRGSFRDFIENSAREDGADLGPQLSLLFQVLNTLESKRQKNLNEEFAPFPYVNGRLFELHKKLAKLKFLDPACGCGNFLVIAYRELRLLELEILRAVRDNAVLSG